MVTAFCCRAPYPQCEGANQATSHSAVAGSTRRVPAASPRPAGTSAEHPIDKLADLAPGSDQAGVLVPTIASREPRDAGLHRLPRSHERPALSRSGNWLTCPTADAGARRKESQICRHPIRVTELAGRNWDECRALTAVICRRFDGCAEL